MNLRHAFLAAAASVAVLVFATGSARAQTTPPTELETPQSATPDLQTLYRILQQQDEELRQLRDRVSGMQNDVHALPPVTDGSANSVTAASAVEPVAATSGPTMFEMQDRLTALEQKVNQQASFEKPKEDPAPKGYEVGSDLKMTASWRNGVIFQSANKDFRYHIGGIIQFDMCGFDNDPDLIVAPAKGGVGPQPDSFDLRRVRLKMDGTMYEVFDWVVQVRFGQLGVGSHAQRSVAGQHESVIQRNVHQLGPIAGAGKFPCGQFQRTDRL